jgi:DNA-binding XRE family transcriptional regulator
MPIEARSSRGRGSPRRKPNLKLIALRVNGGYSREMLALRIGVGRETIRLAEAGYLPTPRVQFALADEFRLQPLDIWPIETQARPRVNRSRAEAAR